MIRLERVRRQFGPRVLFEDLSWLIPEGARLGLVGPNGAGKTTLLRLVAGLDRPDDGTVVRAKRVRVGYLPQEVEAAAAGTVLAAVLDGAAEWRGLEGRVRELEERMARTAPGDPEAAVLSAAYGEARQRFEHLGGERIEARAREILGGLGVPVARFAEPLRALSGGWRMRVILARLLLGEPDLLLLDEPTNHLDLEAIAWLEAYLDGREGAFVVVSHDRFFLNRMVRGIVELETGRLRSFAGGYDAYLDERESRRAAAVKAARQQARELTKTQRFIERFRYKNTKARQVQSRIRALSKVERVDAPRRRRSLRFGFPPAPRSGDTVARLEGVRKAYGATVVYPELDLLLRRGDRVALVGANGAGKSTLLRLLAGTERPDAGTVELGHNVLVRHFAQHHLESLDPGRTVLEEVERVAPDDLRPGLRSLLGRFLFSGNDVDKRVGILSGGERARLALARLLVVPANLLLLDEPTNHLDLPSREVLEDALAEYDGTLVVVSHDRYFINRTLTSIAEVGDGRVDVQPGDYDTFLERCAARQAAGATGVAAATGPRPEGDRRAERRAEAEERNRRYRERRALEDRLAPLEDEIAGLEERLRTLTDSQADPVVYASPDRAAEVAREKRRVEEELADRYSRWEAIADEEPGG
ncbi:MAG: ABC-F family ATP-binding cassette domain-containing protein [Acidobacteriota bacterium]